MTLSFPNPSCSFDATKNRVCFWGYDSVIEVSFLVEADAIRKLCPDMDSAEEGFLKAFVAVRQRIHQVAERVYTHGAKGPYTYILGVEDF